MKDKKAFTLIELIVTIAVLGVLVLLASPRFFGHTQNAELTKGFANAKSIEKAGELYYMDNNDWPRLTDDPYTSEEIESYSERIFNHTGQEINLDPEGNYYDIDYDKLSDYIRVPDDKKNYILQNPVGKVFYMENLNEAGKSRVNYNQVIKNDEDTFEFTATFTNAGSTGRTGPSQSHLDRAYAGTSLAGQVTSSNGIQLWTVPESGTYRIETYGASGGGSGSGSGYYPPGKGAIIKGDVSLTKGDTLKILVGQMGEIASGGYGAGGGGTFVTNSNNSPLIVAGGGGGAGTLNSNTNARSSTGNGNGGTATSNRWVGGAGGGFNGNGSSGYGGGGYSFINGGTGGTARYVAGGGFGGFGGGGGNGNAGAGGGGGYQGGNSGTYDYYAGWGGYSYNAGENQDNSVGNDSHGKVIITYIGEQ